MTVPAPVDYTAWTASLERRFGADPGRWRFRCPACGHITSPADWKALGLTGGRAAQECIGRTRGIPGLPAREIRGCDYTTAGRRPLPGVVTVVRGRYAGGVFPTAEAGTRAAAA
jgi:hypothetical protein